MEKLSKARLITLSIFFIGCFFETLASEYVYANAANVKFLEYLAPLGVLEDYISMAFPFSIYLPLSRYSAILAVVVTGIVAIVTVYLLSMRSDKKMRLLVGFIAYVVLSFLSYILSFMILIKLG